MMVEGPEPDLEAVEAFVRTFQEATGHGATVGHFSFGDSPELAEKLGRLVLEGPKRATAGWVADQDDDDPAVEGQHDVVLGGDGRPLCIVRFDEIRVQPFREADPAFAWDEGEGDRTLRWWRDAHERVFSRRAPLVGEPFTDDSEVSFERFSLVWPERTTEPALLEDGDLSVRAVRPDDRDWVRTVLGDVRSRDGWAVERCPGVVARSGGRTSGVLVLVPAAERTEVVATSVLRDVPGVEDALASAVERLRTRYGWGPADGPEGWP